LSRLREIVSAAPAPQPPADPLRKLALRAIEVEAAATWA
jgi:hypothetical protein